MKRALSVLVATIFFFPLFSQATYSKSIDIDNGDDIGTAIRVVNDGYILLVGSICFSFGFSILKTDFEGNIIWIKSLSDHVNYKPPDCFGNHGIAVKNDENVIYFSGNILNQNTKEDGFLLKTTDQGDSLWLRVYGSPYNDFNGTVSYRTDSSLLFFGQKALLPNNFNKIWLMETDLEGKVKWERLYGDDNNRVGKQDMVQLENGDIVFTYIGCKENNFCIVGDDWVLKMTRINSHGNELWTKVVYNFTESWSPNTMISLDNGGFLLAYYRENFNKSGWWYPPILIWVDSLGNFVKQYEFPKERESTILDLTKISSGVIIGTGYTDKYEMGFAGWVFAISQEGELLWNREIVDLRYPSKLNLFHAVKEAENGGLILTGFIADTFINHIPEVENRNVWLVKLDSVGCLKSNCDDLQLFTGVQEPIFETQPFLIYPNPATNEIFIVQDKDAEKLNQQTLLIFNSTGQKEAMIKLKNNELNNLDVSTFIQGIYYFQIVDEFGRVVQADKIIIIN